MRRLLPILFAALTLSLAQAEGDRLTSKAIWEWSMPKRTDADLVRVVESTQALCFNVLIITPPKGKAGFLADECHKRGMQLYVACVFMGGDKAWRQVMTPEQEARALQPFDPTYQFGGQPVGADEVLTSAPPCWNRPEVRAFFAQKVRDLVALPVDGLAFDFLGYRNYERCYCPLCEKLRQEYVHRHPGATTAQWAEQGLVDFTNEMAAVARQARPAIKLTTHVYPYFRPHPYYGYRLHLDTTGETVSWFFRPHWSLKTVRQRTTDIVSRQGGVFAGQQAAPLVAFDPRQPRDYRSAKRVAADLTVVRQSGAQALQFVELGYLLRKPLVAQAVAEVLGGTYRAPQGQGAH